MAENGPSSKIYSLQDLKLHTSEDDCWISVGGKVYDVTHFLDEHPGGFDIIISNTGRDACRAFFL
jgi:cytochrome b involved in lipid metabolism